jgi:hypothetical protein
MKRLLVMFALALQMASAADASDRRNGAQGSDRGGQSAWRHGTYHGWGVAPRYRCVVPDVCASGYYAYGHWTGQPKTDCSCQSGASRY